MAFDTICVCLISDSELVISATRVSIATPNKLNIFSLRDVLSSELNANSSPSLFVQVARKADIVFVDFSLENAAGIGSLCFSLRQVSTAPIVAICGGRQEDMIMALISGVDDAVTLPIFLPYLQAKILAFRRLAKSIKKSASIRLKKKLRRRAKSIVSNTDLVVKGRSETIEISLSSNTGARHEVVKELISETLESAVDELTMSLTDTIESELAESPYILPNTRIENGDRLEVGRLKIDFQTHRFFVGSDELELTPKEFALIAFLMARPGTAVSRDEILDSVWGINFDTGTNMVDVYMHFVRRKLDAAGAKNVIQTVRGHGYRLVADGTEDT